MIIAFSILDVDPSERKEKIIKFEQLDKTNYLHLDIMDGKFVSNTSFGVEVLKEINQYTNLIIDVHLMVEKPNKYFKTYQKHGADLITFHYEAVKEKQVLKHIKKIKSLNVKSGISIKPNTSVETIKKYLQHLDYVLIMSVEPGKGGQSFIENSLNKIKQLKTYKEKHNLSYLIAVDGGVNDLNAPLIKEAGGDVVIAGSFINKNELNKQLLQKLK